MKKIALLLLGIMLILPLRAEGTGSVPASGNEKTSVHGSFTLAVSPDLWPLAGEWTKSFSGIQPGVKINLLKGLDTHADLTIEAAGELDDKYSPWKMTIARDILVPVAGTANSLVSKSGEGITSEKVRLALTREDPAFRILISNEPGTVQSVAGWLNIDPNQIPASKIVPPNTLIQEVRNSPVTMGFCRLCSAAPDLEMAEAITLIPLDKNGNGTLDHVEQIYGSIPEFLRGVWIGKYPANLVNTIYAVSDATPTDEGILSFLSFLIEQGQGSLASYQLVSLLPNERKSKSEQLIGTLPVAVSKPVNTGQLIITILFGIILLTVVAGYVRRVNRKRTMAYPSPIVSASKGLNLNSLVIPGGVYFDTSHTWAFMEPNGTVRVGMDDFLQHAAGTFTRVRMLKPGDKVSKGDPIGTFIQNGKHLTLKSPITGIIRGENTLLFTDPSLLNRSPYEAGWIYQIEPANWYREIQVLLLPAKYTEWIGNELKRLRDFLAAAMTRENPAYAPAVLQDGGEIADHVLENLGPEAWEDFQNHFIDHTK